MKIKLSENYKAEKKIHHLTRFSKISLAIFCLNFAVVGSYLLFFSHAAGVTGDINGDGTVSITDLSLLLSSYGRSVPACATNLTYTCDLNSDNTVNIVDLSVLLSHYGQSDNTVYGPNNPQVPYVTEVPFADGGAFGSDLSKATLDPNSNAIVQTLVNDVNQHGAFIDNGTEPILSTKNAPSPITPVIMQYPSSVWYPIFKAGIPMPQNAAPGNAATDATITVYDPQIHKIWELWRTSTPVQNAVGCTQPLPWGEACHNDGMWHAYVSAILDDTTFSPGYFDSQSMPGVTAIGDGPGGSHTVHAARVILASEVLAGSINHAVAFNGDTSFNCNSLNAWPAQSNDGSSTVVFPGCVPEGTFFRLDPTIQLCDQQAGSCAAGTVALPHFTYLVAKATQKYGMCDCESTIGGLSLMTEDTKQYGYDAWDPTYLLDGYHRYDLMRMFPWADLQVVQEPQRQLHSAVATSTIAATTTSLNIKAGQSVTWTFNLTPSDGQQAAGFVYLNQAGWNNNGDHVGIKKLQQNSGTLTRQFTQAGTYQMTIAYGGDETVKPSQTSIFTVTVNP